MPALIAPSAPPAQRMVADILSSRTLYEVLGCAKYADDQDLRRGYMCVRLRLAPAASLVLSYLPAYSSVPPSLPHPGRGLVSSIQSEQPLFVLPLSRRASLTSPQQSVYRARSDRSYGRFPKCASHSSHPSSLDSLYSRTTPRIPPLCRAVLRLHHPIFTFLPPILRYFTQKRRRSMATRERARLVWR